MIRSKTRSSGRPATVGLPEELTGTVPRQVGLTAAGTALAAFAAVLAAAAFVSAILMSIAYERQDRERQLRARDAVAAEALVLEVRVTRGEHPRSIAAYSYDVEGRRHSGRATLGERDRRTVRTGSIIPIRYLASRPDTSWTAGDEPGGFPILLIPLVATALLLGAALLVWALRRQWILLTEGRAALARITADKKVRRGHQEVHSVAYEFQTLSGAVRTGSYESGRAPLPVGTLLPVVYHRENPSWSAKYPMQLVRPRRLR